MSHDQRKLAYIDALRGWAILAVMLLHSSYAVPPESSWLAWLMQRGELGVQLFYIVSAITLCMSWDARSGRDCAPARNFLLRRFFRIAPMFYLALIFYVWLNGFAPRHWAPYGVHWSFVAATGLFLHGLHPETINSVVPGGWSVTVEMTFYLLLPLLLARLGTLRLRMAFAALSIVLAYLAKNFWIHFFSPLYPPSQDYLVTGSAYYSFPVQLPVFAIGLLFYWVLRHARRWPNFLMLANLGVLVFAVSMALTAAGLLQAMLENYLVASTLWALLAINLAQRPLRMFCNPLTQFLGRISFSLYLTHFAVLQTLGNCGFQNLFPQTDLGSLTYYGCVCVCATAVAYPCYRLIELNGVALGKRVIAALDRRTSARTEVGAVVERSGAEF